MGWFEKKYEPNDIVAKLHAALLKASSPLSVWHQSIKPSAAESDRLKFTLFLLPLALCHLHTQDAKNVKFAQAVQAAFEIYLDNYRDKNEIITIGDYIIWGCEKDSISYILREKYFIPVTSENLGAESLKMNILLHAAADVRKRAATCDFQMGINNAPEKANKEILISVLQMFAATFSKQVIKFDLANYNSNAAEAERFLKSQQLAVFAISTVYFEVMQTIQA